MFQFVRFQWLVAHAAFAVVIFSPTIHNIKSVNLSSRSKFWPRLTISVLYRGFEHIMSADGG